MKPKCMEFGCLKRIEPPMMLCSEHWRNLPTPTKDEVNKRLYGWQDREQAKMYLATALTRLRRINENQVLRRAYDL